MSKGGKFLLGVGAGVGLGLLFAPKKGEETRKELKEKCDELLTKIKQIDVKEVKENITEKVIELQNELRDLDKEKAKAIAVQKGEAIKAKADELVSLAVKKSTPAVQKAAKEVKEATVKVLKGITAKIETPKKKPTKTTKKATE